MVIEQSFVDRLAFLGPVEVIRFSQFTSSSHDLFKIRNYALSLELSGTFNDNLLSATYRIKDEDIINYLEEEILSILAVQNQPG